MKMGTMELQMRGMYAAGINITQPIYTGGKLTAGKRLAKIGTDVARQKMRLTNAEIISNADNAYWTLMSIDGKVEMLRSYINQMDTLYAQTTNAVTAGMGTKNDLLRIEARRSEIEYNLKKALNGRDLCRMALCRVIGVDFDTQITLTDNNIRISEPGMLVNDISNRPELSMLNLSIDANIFPQWDLASVTSVMVISRLSHPISSTTAPWANIATLPTMASEQLCSP
jgi:outer membrane protein TolC